MTARKSAPLGPDLPAMPPSRRPPASGAAPVTIAPTPTMGHASFGHSTSTATSVSRVRLRGAASPPKTGGEFQPQRLSGGGDAGLILERVEGDEAGSRFFLH